MLTRHAYEHASSAKETPLCTPSILDRNGNEYCGASVPNSSTPLAWPVQPAGIEVLPLVKAMQAEGLPECREITG